MQNELTPAHIHTLVTHFYRKVQRDELLAPIFNDIAAVDWPHHIPLLCQFWNSIMLKTNEYHGNAYLKHVLIGRKAAISEAHFARWLSLFQAEALKHLPAAAAEIITQRATQIASSLQYGMVGVSAEEEIIEIEGEQKGVTAIS